MMRAALVAEYRKLVTTRLWWILLAVMAAYMALIAAGLGWSLSQDTTTTGTGDEVVLTPDAVVRSVYTVAVSLGYVFPLLVGALAFSAEFRHKTITPTLLVEPSRTRVLLAKLGANGVVGLLFGAVGTAAAVLVGAGVLAAIGEETFLDSASTWRSIGLSVLALALWALLGTALGSVLTNQVAVIVVVLAFTQFVEPIARVVLGLTSWGSRVAAFLPGAAGEAVSGGSLYSATGMTSLLSWWQGLLVLLAYVVVLSAIGRITTLRRDIT